MHKSDLIKIDKKIMVHAYKRNGWFYRTWEFPKVVDSKENYICVSLKNVTVITNDKDNNRNFKSKNVKNAFWFFFKDEWFNIIATLTDANHVDYYVNLASPFIYEEEAIKYYDFDLDIKMKSNLKGFFRILDVDEFNQHKIEFNYEQKLIEKVLETLDRFKNEKFRNDLVSKINSKLLQNYTKKI